MPVAAAISIPQSRLDDAGRYPPIPHDVPHVSTWLARKDPKI